MVWEAAWSSPPSSAVQGEAGQGEINGLSKRPAGASCSSGPPMTTRTPTPEKSPRGTQPKTWGAERGMEEEGQRERK